MKRTLLFLCALFACLAPLFVASFASAQSEVEEASLDALDFPIIFAKQHNYQGLHIYDTYYQYRPGGGIYVLENPSDPPEKRRARPIIDPTTPETLGEGVYSWPALSYDATKLLFCFKGAPNGNTNIYEIGVDGRGLRQVTNFDFEPNSYCGSGAGWHDYQPDYLPDGRIVFTSTRYSGLVPCANNGVALVFVMNADGSDLHPLSVNNVTEFNPTTLEDGRIVFGRWEYIDKNALTIQSLWTVYPDGTNETALFANNMVFPEAILQPRPVPGRPDLLVGVFAGHNGPPRGAIACVDVSGDKDDPNAIFNFEYPDVSTFDRGQSCDPWPLNENVVLYSGMIADRLPCEEPTNPNAPQRIGAVLPQPKGSYNSLLMIDRNGRRVEILRDDSIDLHYPIPLVPRTKPRVAPDSVDRSQNVGRFFVNDVYKGLEGVERGAVKWLRVVEETSRVSPSPGSNGLNQTFSISAALSWSPKNYLGIVPVKEDGSVYFEVPSGRAVYFQLLDENYRLVRSMRTFVQAAQGATRSCVGCHEYGPPELTDAGAVRYPKDAAERLADESWGGGYLDYPSQIQPIWNAKCVECHGGREIAAGLDLSGGWTRAFNVSYENLTSRRRNQYQIDLIAGVCCMNGTAHYSCKFFAPYEHGSGAAPLAKLLLEDPIHRELLTKEERELVFTWIDSNGLYFGSWDYTASGPLLAPWEDAKRELIAVMEAPENGCASCHADESGRVRRFENDWINLERPEASRILRAPLAKSEGEKNASTGLALCRARKFDQKFLRLGVMSGGQYEHAVKELRMFPTQEWREWDESGEPIATFKSTDDPVYSQMTAIIERARARALANPRIDMPNACDAPGGIVEGASRQILPQPLPTRPIKFDADVDAESVVKLRWERSARTIGLVFELWRGETPDFAPEEGTLLTKTTRFEFDDKTALVGKNYYALVPVSDPTTTCGSYRLSKESVESDKFPILRGTPLRKSAEVPTLSAPNAPRDLKATSEIERVSLKWNAPLETVRFNVYRQAPNEAEKTKLTPSPIFERAFNDETATPGVEYRYFVAATTRRDVESEPTQVAASAKVAPKLVLLDAPFETSFDARSDLSEQVATPETRGNATIKDGALKTTDGAFLVFPHRDEYCPKRRFTLELEVYFDAPGVMPVVVGAGKWNNSGWFLQRFQNKWRFHFAGVDCDGKTEAPVGSWLRVVAKYDGEKLRVFQDGQVVGEVACNAVAKPWRGDLFVGQYSAQQEPSYQFVGKIRNLKILDYVETNE